MVNGPARAAALLLVDEAQPGADASLVRQALKKTAEAYEAAGDRVAIVNHGQLVDWATQEAGLSPRALRDVIYVRYAEHHSFDAVGGLRSHSDRRFGQSAHYPWIINLRLCTREGPYRRLSNNGTACELLDATIQLGRLPQERFRVPVAFDERIVRTWPFDSDYGTGFIGLVDCGQPDPNARFMVGGVLAGSPADDAGLHAGDILISVDGEPVSTKNAPSVFAASTPGTELRVAILRRGDLEERVIHVADRFDFLRRTRENGLKRIWRSPVLRNMSSSTGDAFSLSAIETEFIVLFFWRMRSYESRRAIPILDRLACLADELETSVVGVSTDTDIFAWREFMEFNRLRGYHVRAPKWADELSVVDVPTVLVIDRSGRVLANPRPELTLLAIRQLAHQRREVLLDSVARPAE